ncbi:MAG: O-antigen ligase family protein [Patescibacteria group bacterium]
MKISAFTKQALWWAGALIGVEVVSTLVLNNTTLNTVACLLVGLVVFWLGWKKPTLGLAALALELFVGSKGYLLQMSLGSSAVSLRIVMTGLFFLGWLINFFQQGSVKELANLFRDKRAYLVLFIVIGYATMRGMMLHNPDVYADGNAWGDWLLLFPVLDVTWRYRDRIRRDVMPVFVVGIFWLAIKTIGLEYVFSHGFTTVSAAAYAWSRHTGVAEITWMLANAFRIFMQSYIYAIAALIAAMGWWISASVVPAKAGIQPRPGDLGWVPASARMTKNQKLLAWWTMAASTVILGISLSRSFWIGASVGIVAMLAILTLKKVAWWKKLLGPLSAALAGVAVIFAVLAFPFPHVDVASLSALLSSRSDIGQEAAAVSRWHLLPVLWNKIEQHPILGSGFGATVTYQSEDPRIVSQTGGTYTTYAFEWGWLDHWIKFGIIGIPLIAYLLWSLGKRLWKLDEPLWLKTSAVAALIALATVHFFTPYLNHPLGFLFFFVGEGMILSSGVKQHELS